MAKSVWLKKNVKVEIISLKLFGCVCLQPRRRDFETVGVLLSIEAADVGGAVQRCDVDLELQLPLRITLKSKSNY